MHGVSVALYWDPALKNNGHRYTSPNHEPSLLSSSPDHATTKSHDAADIVPETTTITQNISTILGDYGTLFTYASPHDFILHLYHLGNAFSVDPSKADFNLFLYNPILIFLTPDTTPEHCAIVRFTSYLAFNFPSVTTVLSSAKSAPSGANNSIGLDIDQASFAELKQQSTNLTQRTILSTQRHPSVSTIESISNVPVHDADPTRTEEHLISFQRSQQHTRYFLSALEVFHQSQSSKNYKFFLNYSKAQFSESDYPSIFNLTLSQMEAVIEDIVTWDFRAHDLNYDQLLYAAFSMIKHGLSSPHIDYSLYIDDTTLLKFLLLVRDSYRPSNPYHNFRHAVDVLQATFYFLLRLHSLPPLGEDIPVSTDADEVLSPVEALIILIVAIGHDVGHPGVTNMFLVKSHAPIASVFNNRSVLESFHSAAFGEILARYWPSLQSTPLCRLIVKSVLATDMALHFDYMEEVSTIIESPLENKKVQLDDLSYRTLICCLLIKCADISNVARKLPISSQWGMVLSKEFAEVEALEVALEIKPAPVLPIFTNIPGANGHTDEHLPLEKEEASISPEAMITLAKGQFFFINTFAKPLFSAVSKILPQLRYTLIVLEENAGTWARKLDEP